MFFLDFLLQKLPREIFENSKYCLISQKGISIGFFSNSAATVLIQKPFLKLKCIHFFPDYSTFVVGEIGFNSIKQIKKIRKTKLKSQI